MTDYTQEQADELEALASIFADDLEGAGLARAQREDRTWRGDVRMTIRGLHMPLPPLTASLTLAHALAQR